MTQPGEGKLTPQQVNQIHANSDKDSSSVAQHHTLGIDPNQASPGHHNHNGANSKLIGKGLNPGFPLTAAVAYSQSDFQEIIDALRDLGFGS
jgi:hypothetical protein